MVGADSAFVIAENGNLPVTVIVKLNFFWNTEVCVLQLLKEC